MIEALKEYNEKLALFLTGQIDLDQLEQFSMGLIARDDFDELDGETQDIIYTLDNSELNELTSKDFVQLKKELEDKLSQL